MYSQEDFLKKSMVKKLEDRGSDIYELGSKHKFSEKELRNSAWMKALADKYNEKKASGEEGSRTQKDIEQYFFRKEHNRKDGRDEFGLIERLRRLGFDIDKFDGPKAKEARVKLLYFLFGFELEYKVKISPFLSQPSFENIDNSIVGNETRNGELMAYLKNNIMKEIDEDYIITVKDTLNYIIDQWETHIYYVRHVANVEKDLDLLDDIYTDMQWIVDLVERESEASEVYCDSLLESFYLKLSLHEMIGREKELVDISETNFKGGMEVNKFQREQFEKYMTETITICWKKENRYEEVLSYIENHRKELARCVFGNEKISGNDFRKFDMAAEHIPQLLDFYGDNTKACFADSVPVNLLISYMQVYIFENEKIDSDFYRQRSSDKVMYRTELNNGKEALRRSQYALLEKVNRRCFTNLGRNNIDIKLREIERCFDTLLLNVYSSNSLVELNNKAWILLSYIETFVGRRLIVERRFNCLIDFLNNNMFELLCCDRRIIYNFLNHMDEVLFYSFMDGIRGRIADSEDNSYICTFDIEQDDLYTDDRLEAFLKIDISIEDKKIDVVSGGIRTKDSLP